MPDITISSELSANNHSVPEGVSTVTFHSAVACTVCFQEAETFGITSFNIAANIVVTLTLHSRLATEFEPIPLGTRCSLTKGSTPGIGVHTIGMDSGKSLRG